MCKITEIHACCPIFFNRSNFEIADLSFFRSKAYLDFFEMLDKTGGFFYERWGDAPIHSIAAALLLERKEIHFFNEIGYRHGIYEHCPESPALQLKCSCDPADNVGRCFSTRPFLSIIEY